MKITSFYPMIISKNAKELIELYKALGFEEKHFRDELPDTTANCTTLVDANNYRIAISQADDVAREMTVVHINVDNFDEAYEIYKSKGYFDARPQVTRTPSSVSQLMVTKEGTGALICQHIK